MKMDQQAKYDGDLVLVRAAIFNGVPLPPKSVARLEARGINVGELESRIRQQLVHGAWY